MSLPDLLNAIPALLSYYVPGYMFVLVFSLGTRAIDLNKGESETKRIVPCIVISYILSTIIKLIPFLKNLSEPLLALITYVAAIVLGYIAALIWKTKAVRNYTQRAFGITNHAHVWDDVLADEGHRIRFYAEFNHKKARIEGDVKFYETNADGNCTIAIRNYVITYEDGAKYQGVDNAVIIYDTDKNVIECFGSGKKK